jgi:hypothetical protein
LAERAIKNICIISEHQVVRTFLFSQPHDRYCIVFVSNDGLHIGAELVYKGQEKMMVYSSSWVRREPEEVLDDTSRKIHCAIDFSGGPDDWDDLQAFIVHDSSSPESIQDLTYTVVSTMIGREYQGIIPLISSIQLASLLLNPQFFESQH